MTIKLERIFFSGVVKLLFLSFLTLVFSLFTTVEVRAQQSNRLQYYGVDEVEVDELPSLAAKGINMAMMGIWADDLGTLEDYLNAAEAVGIKMLIWPLGSHQGDSNLPWFYTNGNWNMTDGRDLLEYCQNYIEGGGQGLLAVMSIHEPFWSAGLPSGSEDDAIRKLYTAMKNIAPDVPVFAYIDELYTFEQQGYEITDGMCDWCGVWRHTMCHSTSNCQGAEGTKEYSKQQIRNDRGLIEQKGLNMKLIYSVQTFAEPAGYIMPSYDEAYNFTCEVIAENNLEGILYYSWRPPAGHYTDWLQKHYAQNKELKGLIEDVYANCVQGLASPPPSPSPPTSPSPSPSPSFAPSPSPSAPPACQLDLSGDGSVNLADIIRILGKYGASNCNVNCPEDVTGDGNVNLQDIVYILQYWGQTCQQAGGSLELYGVKFADNSDFNSLKNLEIKQAAVTRTSPGELNDAMQAAENAGIKIIPWCWETDPYGCYNWNGSNWTISAAGKEFLKAANQEMAKGANSRIFAVYGNHEPYYYGLTNNQAKALVAKIKTYLNNQGQDYHLKIYGKIYSDVSCDYSDYPSRCQQERDSFADGICDYCAVMYHPYRANPREYRKTQMMADLERDLNSIKSVPPGITLNKFIPYLGIIHWPDSGVYGTGQYMPDSTEMYDGASSILNHVSSQGYQADGLVWYTWGNNAGWTGLRDYNGDGERNGRFQVMRDIANLR